MELFKKQKPLDYFKKCHEISIWAFFELLQTNDLSLLLKPKSREIKESDKEELSKAYFNLFGEYVELSEDRHIIDMLQERGKLNFNFKIGILEYDQKTNDVFEIKHKLEKELEYDV